MRKLLFLFLLFVSTVSWAQDLRHQASTMNYRAIYAVKAIESHAVRDSLSFYRNVVDVVDFSLKCDSLDRMPDSKGVVKERFAADNHLRLNRYTPRLIDASLYMNRKAYHQEAISALKLYLKSRQNHFVSQNIDESSIAVYYLAQMEFNRGNYDAANRYADMAMHYDETATQAVEVKAQCMQRQLKTHEDSLRYLAVINRLYEMDPQNNTYFAWIMKFYQRPTRQYNIEYFIDRELQNHPDSIVPWILKGEIAMNAKRWDEAIDAYKHASGLKPKMIPVAYNAGLCLTYKAMEEREVMKRRNKTLTADDEREIMNYYADARTYMERVRHLDPKRKKVDWVTPLYNIYRVLGEKVKADELEPLVTGFKNNN